MLNGESKGKACSWCSERTAHRLRAMGKQESWWGETAAMHKAVFVRSAKQRGVHFDFHLESTILATGSLGSGSVKWGLCSSLGKRDLGCAGRKSRQECQRLLSDRWTWMLYGQVWHQTPKVSFPAGCSTGNPDFRESRVRGTDELQQ